MSTLNPRDKKLFAEFNTALNMMDSDGNCELRYNMFMSVLFSVFSSKSSDTLQSNVEAVLNQRKSDHNQTLKTSTGTFTYQLPPTKRELN